VDFGGGSAGGIWQGFFMPLAQLNDTTGVTHSHLPENQSVHQVFFSILLSITKIKKIYEQQKQPRAGHILLPVISDRLSPRELP
jgi:hypothetical protein